MKRISAIWFFFLVSTFVKAQDSAQVLTHEIGFNTVSLIKQVISNNPTSTLPQLPYDIFYNLYFENLVGVRVGLGFLKSHNETPISGQLMPRTTDQTSLNLRGGLSYNFVRSKKITLNGFADFILENMSIETATTFTTKPFQSPIETVSTKSKDKLDGIGGEIGVGVKYNIIKHLSIYVEVPIVFITEKTTSSFTTNQVGAIYEPPTSVKNSVTRVVLPTTIYLVLRF